MGGDTSLWWVDSELGFHVSVMKVNICMDG